MGTTSIVARQRQPPLRIVNAHLRFPRVSPLEPNSSPFDNFAANNVAAMPILYRLA